ncbi:MAG: microcystin-dependent protein [Gammaproteobacteria bacterium]
MFQISQFDALFSILGATFGGNGRTTFALPDLDGRVAVGAGSGPGLSNWRLAEKRDLVAQTLTLAQQPSHDHDVADVRDSTSTSGSENPSAISTTQDALGLNYLI